MIGSPVGGTASAFIGFNHVMPIVRKYMKGLMWLHFLIGAPPVIVVSSACAGRAGGAVSALAQLASSSYRAAVSSSQPPQGKEKNTMHKSPFDTGRTYRLPQNHCSKWIQMQKGLPERMKKLPLLNKGTKGPELTSFAAAPAAQPHSHWPWLVMLELLTGRKTLDSSRTRAEQSLVRWATPQPHDIDALSKMVDYSLNGMYPAKSLSRFADIIAL